MEAYLWYLENVLGLRAVVWPQMASPIRSEAEDQAVVQTAPKLPHILFVDTKAWSQPAVDLFTKMREAMKLGAEQVTILNAAQVSSRELQVAVLAADRVVSFSQEIHRGLQKEAEFKFATHSPEDLLMHPELKKQTWEDLKLVMKSIGLL